MIRAWLIRHAESQSNAGLPSSDPSLIPLTGLGREQAQRIAAGLTAEPTLIVTSPFLRARQTAAPAISRFPDSQCQQWPVQEFTYLGHLHGQVMTAEQRRPHARAYWDRGDPDHASAGSESFSDLLGRVSDLTGRLAAVQDGPVAVFTHGYFIKAVIWSLLTGQARPEPEAMRNFREFAAAMDVPNGGIVELRRQTGSVHVVLGAVTAHLPDTLAGQATGSRPARHRSRPGERIPAGNPASPYGERPSDLRAEVETHGDGPMQRRNGCFRAG